MSNRFLHSYSELNDEHSECINQFILDCLKYYSPGCSDDILAVNAELIRATMTGVLGKCANLWPEMVKRMLNLLKSTLAVVISGMPDI